MLGFLPPPRESLGWRDDASVLLAVLHPAYLPTALASPRAAAAAAGLTGFSPPKPCRAARSCMPAMLERKYTHLCTHMGRDVETLTTRVFNNGNSQAVRIPAEFRLDTDRVSISRNESGDLVIHPLRAERGAALLDALRAVGEADIAFVAALEAERACPQPMQERAAL